MSSGGDFRLTAEKMRDKLLSQMGRTAQSVDRTIATGYGSKMVSFADEVKSDILCHAKESLLCFPL